MSSVPAEGYGECLLGARGADGEPRTRRRSSGDDSRAAEKVAPPDAYYMVFIVNNKGVPSNPLGSAWPAAPRHPGTTCRGALLIRPGRGTAN